MGESTYRAEQIYEWLYRHGVSSFSEMTNLSESLRAKLQDHFFLTPPVCEVFESSDGTRKYRLKLQDEKSVEMVWLPEESRNTLCISSQVGCALACAFCVTGKVGFLRNLNVDEIVQQLRSVIFDDQRPVSNVVFMGMGEPLLNMEAVLKAIRVFIEPKGLAMGKRKITVSTAGIVPKIRPFLERAGVKMAISLTGASNASRDHWMPINQKYNLEDLASELRRIPIKKGRVFFFEVVLMKDENDSEEEARRLAKVLKGIPARVNLIPYNENGEFPHLKRPPMERVQAFQDILMKNKIRTLIRKNRGEDVMAACGQLAAGHLEK